MDLQQRACSSQSIEQFLADQLSGAELAAFEDHLEHCTACRHSLDGTAAERSWWDEARGYLSHSDASGEEALEETPTALCGLETYLTATDDPRMLGRLGGYEIAGIIGRGGMGV